MPIGGIISSVLNPLSIAQIAMGPAGWASLAMRTLGAQIAMNAIQQFGEKMGLPQVAIDLVQASVANSMGMPGLARQNIGEVVKGLGEQFNLSPREQAGLQRSAQFDINKFTQDIERAVERGRSEGSGRGRGARGGGSILEIIANAMNKAMNSKVGQMQDLASQMDNVKHKKGKTDSISDQHPAASRHPGILDDDECDQQHDQDDRRRSLDRGPQRLTARFSRNRGGPSRPPLFVVPVRIVSYCQCIGRYGLRPGPIGRLGDAFVWL